MSILSNNVYFFNTKAKYKYVTMQIFSEELLV